MKCPQCAAAVEETQRFCNACGADLRGVTDHTEVLDAQPTDQPATLAPPVPADAADVADLADLAEPPSVDDSSDRADELAWGPDQVAANGVTQDEPPRSVPDAPALDPNVIGGTDSTPIAARRPIPRSALDDVADASGPVPISDVPIPDVPSADIWATTQVPAPTAAAVLAEREATGRVSTLDADPLDDHATTEQPAVADFGEDSTADIPTPIVVRDPARVRLVLVLAVFAAVAALLAAVADIIDLRTSRPVDGISSGFRQLEDLGTNLAIGSFIGAGVLFVGAVLASVGVRWGAGLAGGAGLSLIGWSALVIALAETPIAVAADITRNATGAPFTLTITRDTGWWLVIGVGGLGLLAFLASLRQAGSGGRAGLNPWIAAVGAVVGLAIATGPLIPVRSAAFADNVRSAPDNLPLPDAYFAGRLVHVALIALVAVAGFLLVRRWGLGLVAGGLSIPAWLWASSLAAFGDRPVGIAEANVGAADTVPHGVTTVGIILTAGVLAVAVTAAAVRRRN